MSKTYIPKALRERITVLGRNRCEYCLTQTQFAGHFMEIDHIVPEVLGGPTAEENLCLACGDCNLHKGDKVVATDPLSDELVLLFNPRLNVWAEHFEWIRHGTYVEGKTPVGRATVIALALNREPLLTARRAWVAVGWHPPQD